MVSFHEYLQRKAEQYGFGEPKKSEWVRYMETDVTRGKVLIQHVMDAFDLSLGPGSRALDIGCGFGGQLAAFQGVFDEHEGIELMEERVVWAKRRVPGAGVVCGNASKLPWPDDHFDLVVANDVFEHVPHEEQLALAAEMARVMKVGGAGFVAVPNRFQLRDEHNQVWFGTWFPGRLRRLYVKTFSSNRHYTRCFERTGRGWESLFLGLGLEVKRVPTGYRRRMPMPPSRYLIYLRKHRR
jgi:ubiquinone/menaquinone biosynthesis C-methylase UbiE